MIREDRRMTWKPGKGLVWVVVVLLTGTIGTGAAGTGQEESRPPGVQCAGFQVVPGLGPACPRDNDLWEVFSRDGTSLGLTHGGDPLPDDPEEAAAGPYSSPMIKPRCVSSTDYRTVVIYARAYDDADRWSSLYWDLSDLVTVINTHLRVDAGRFNVQLDYKVRCNTAGTPHIYPVTLPTPMANADFSSIVTDLRDLGWDDPRAKYMVWYDDTSVSTFAGYGHIYDDDRLIADNLNNGVAQPMYGVTFGHMSPRVMMHEHGHNMGAVQLSAAHSTGGFHCTDGLDVMCYDDDAPKGHHYSGSICRSGSLLEAHREFFDCNNDDYFHPAAPSGSYLATHWNLGSSLNRFLERDNCGLAREGKIMAPGAGVYVRGVSWNTEDGIDPSCWGRTFSLASVSGGADFDVCFYQGTTRLACFEEAGDEAGAIPSGTTEARVFQWYGMSQEYVLYTP